jgi:hypothetical protein
VTSGGTDAEKAGTVTTRPLTHQEHAVLARLLSVPVAGADQLRAQAQAAQATIRETVAAGLDLVVPTSAPSAALPDGPVRLTAEVYDPAGHYLGELLLWVKDGRLTSLEYAWVTDVAPTALPAVEAIRVTA